MSKPDGFSDVYLLLQRDYLSKAQVREALEAAIDRVLTGCSECRGCNDSAAVDALERVRAELIGPADLDPLHGLGD